MHIEGWSCHFKIDLLWPHHALYLHKYLHLENNQGRKHPAKFIICIDSMSFRDGRSPLEIPISSRLQRLRGQGQSDMLWGRASGAGLGAACSNICSSVRCLSVLVHLSLIMSFGPGPQNLSSQCNRKRKTPHI